MLNLILYVSFYCSHFKFSMLIPLDNLQNESSEFGQNSNFNLWQFFFNCAFYLVFVIALKIITELSFCYSNFEWPDMA